MSTTVTEQTTTYEPPTRGVARGGTIIWLPGGLGPAVSPSAPGGDAPTEAAPTPEAKGRRRRR